MQRLDGHPAACGCLASQLCAHAATNAAMQPKPGTTARCLQACPLPHGHIAMNCLLAKCSWPCCFVYLARLVCRRRCGCTAAPALRSTGRSCRLLRKARVGGWAHLVQGPLLRPFAALHHSMFCAMMGTLCPGVYALFHHAHAARRPTAVAVLGAGAGAVTCSCAALGESASSRD